LYILPPLFSLGVSTGEGRASACAAAAEAALMAQRPDNREIFQFIVALKIRNKSFRNFTFRKSSTKIQIAEKKSN
jgi:glycine cleavage system pyridoxal-binding protein P